MSTFYVYWLGVGLWSFAACLWLADFALGVLRSIRIIKANQEPTISEYVVIFGSIFNVLMTPVNIKLWLFVSGYEAWLFATGGLAVFALAAFAVFSGFMAQFTFEATPEKRKNDSAYFYQ